MQDDLLFYQIILPIRDVNDSRIDDDPRHNNFSDAENFSACYAFVIGLLGFYGHNFKVPKIDELVKFDGLVIRDGVRKRSYGALYHSWKYNVSDFDA